MNVLTLLRYSYDDGRDRGHGQDFCYQRDGTGGRPGQVPTTCANRKRCLWDRGAGAVYTATNVRSSSTNPCLVLR